MFTKRFFSSVFLFIFTSTMLVSSFTPATSSYSYLVNILDCNNIMYMRGCRHEIGHKMDDDLGQPSLSIEFSTALAVYMINPPDNSFTKLMETYRDIYNYRPGNASYETELYAAIYAWANGNVSLIPEILRSFYSSDRSYLRLYKCLANTDKVNICGWNNFSYIKTS